MHIGHLIMNSQRSPPPPLMGVAESASARGLNSSRKRRKESAGNSRAASGPCDVDVFEHGKQGLNAFLSRFGGVDEMAWHLLQNSVFKVELDETAERFGCLADVKSGLRKEASSGRTEAVSTCGSLPNELVEYLTHNSRLVESSLNPDNVICTSLLGKRGRCYEDVWSETDYLSRQHSQPNQFHVYKNWTELIHSYTDDFDGNYMEKLMRHVERQKKKYALGGQNVASIADYNVIGSHGKRPDVTKRRQRDGDYENEDDSVQRGSDPPVPVSCWHPAAWYLTDRSCHSFEKQLASRTAPSRFECIHPASLRTQKQPALSLHERYSIRGSQVGDIDELDLELDKLMQEHVMLEFTNICRLNRLEDAVHNGHKLEELERERSHLEDDVLAIWAKINLLSPERNMYKLRPLLGGTTLGHISTLGPLICPSTDSSDVQSPR
jgi:hypothetical protein